MDPSQAPAGGTPTAPTQDELEWASAADDFVSDRGVDLDEKKKEDPTNEPTQPKEEPKEGEETPPNPDDKKPNEEQKPGDGSQKEGEGDPTDPAEGSEPTIRDRLAEEAELKQTREAITEDVRKKLFSDKPTRLEDADGDPIETVADVMKLQNPATRKPFTAEEAASWLLRAQDHFEKQSKADQAEIDKIVEVNVTMKYDLEAIRSEYGELLKHLPNLRQKLTDAFLKTVDIGSDGETIVGTKIGMKEFYDVALAPYVKQAEQLKADEEAKAKAEADRKAAEEQRKQEQAQQQKQTRSDRGDVFSTRTKIEDMTDPEEKEWAGVAKEYYEG